MEKEAVVKSGTFLTGLLTIIYMVLKLTGVINWSWWWVLSPLWLPVVLVLFVLLVVFTVVFIVEYNKVRKTNQEREKFKRWYGRK